MTGANRIAITGIGLIGSWGATLDDLWNAQQDNKADFSPCSRYNNGLPAAEVKNLNLHSILRSSQLSRSMLVSQYAVAATHLAITQAKIEPKRGKRNDSIGIVYGTSNGPGAATQQIYDDLLDKGPVGVKPRVFQESVFSAPASMISIHFGFSGPIRVVSAGGCSGAVALFQAQIMLAQPDISAVIVLCSDEICDAIQKGLRDVKWHATYDLKGNVKDGAVAGEGAVAMVLESLEAAQQRGVPVISELVGVGLANDASSLAFPAEDGRGLASAIRSCLEDAQYDKEKVDLILTGSAGTKVEDRLEKAALCSVFGDSQPAQGNAKSSVGFAMGAAALVEVTLSISAIIRNKFPKSVTSSVSCKSIDSVLCNAVSHNGQYGAILVRRTLV